MKVRAILFHQHGNPTEVAGVESGDLPGPQPHEALVRMAAAPINPADLNKIEGKYGLDRPSLPRVAGGEGAGFVEAIGAEVRRVRIGDLVILPGTVGTWCEACLVDAAALVVVPPGIAPGHAAMLRVNPSTAFRMLRDMVLLQPGDWVVQNAANSAVGRAVIQLARTMGLRTLSLVRRVGLLEELRGLGGDAVLLDDEAWPAAARDIFGEAAPRLALNAVGGDSALRMANVLAPGGTVVTFGAMGRQPLRIPNGLLIFRDIRWRGFWISQWFRAASPQLLAAMWAEIFAHAQRGLLHAPVEAEYPLDACAEALAHAQKGGRAGKILFRFTP